MGEFLQGVSSLLIYFAIAASAALFCRRMFTIPDEVFRKLLHCILLGSLAVFVFGFSVWWHAVATSIAFAVVVYPLLALAEHIPGFSGFLTERRKGELKNSLLLVFFMFAAVMSVCWGWLKDVWLVLTSIYAWGFGDAVAALVGKKWGKHKICFGPADRKKSVEGSAAMFSVSFISVAVLLVWRGGMHLMACLLVALIVAFVSALAELCSKDGNDTVICPLSAMAALLPLVFLLGGLA